MAWTAYSNISFLACLAPMIISSAKHISVSGSYCSSSSTLSSSSAAASTSFRGFWNAERRAGAPEWVKRMRWMLICSCIPAPALIEQLFAVYHNPSSTLTTTHTHRHTLQSNHNDIRAARLCSSPEFWLFAASSRLAAVRSTIQLSIQHVGPTPRLQIVLLLQHFSSQFYPRLFWGLQLHAAWRCISVEVLGLADRHLTLDSKLNDEKFSTMLTTTTSETSFSHS